MNRLKCLLVMLVTVTAVQSQAEVWSNQRSWSPSEEARYSRWVKTVWGSDFFLKQRIPGMDGGNDGGGGLGGLFGNLFGGGGGGTSAVANPFYGLRLDCADTVYAMRMTYSYLRKLPFAILDPTSGKRLITNNMSRFDGKGGSDARARAFLTYLFDVVSTESLKNDTYPVAISRETVRPGSLLLATKKNHHSWTVKDILETGVPWLVFNSTVGRDSGSHLQERRTWPNGFWVFEDNYTPEGHAGFRDWRPIEYIGREVSTVPGYSEEQYQMGATKWSSYSMARLALRKEGLNERLLRLADSACGDLRQRVGAVNEGVLQLRRGNFACMGAAAYDQLSTPSKDKRLFDELMTLRKAYANALKNGTQLRPEVQSRLAKIFPFPQSDVAQETRRMAPQGVDDNSLCVIEYIQGKYMDMAEARRRQFLGNFSSSPMDEIEFRWGDLKGPSETAASCPSY